MDSARDKVLRKGPADHLLPKSAYRVAGFGKRPLSSASSPTGCLLAQWRHCVKTPVTCKHLLPFLGGTALFWKQCEQTRVSVILEYSTSAEFQSARHWP
jgi:hypothetical protein